MDNWGEGVGEVVHRKCGTCRHFAEGSMAASGRCLHPLRRELEHMVLVRKNELACRNGWDEDLWEPKGAEPSTQPPATQDGSPDAAADTANDQQPVPIDRVASITVVPGRHSQPDTSPAARDPEQPASEAADQSEDPVIEQRSAIQVAKRRRQEALAQERARAQALVPILADEESREQPAPPRAVGTAGSSTKQAEPERTNGNGQGALQSRTVVPLDEYTKPARRQTALLSNGQAGYASDSRSAHPIIRLRTESEGTAPAPSTWSGNQPRTPANQGQQWADPSVEPDIARPIPRRMPSPEREAPRLPEIPEPPAVEQLTLDTPPARRPLPEQLSCLVQKCGTCRDFRPAEAGDRGWCHNSFAFDHRRMVHPDELACASTIGVWWVANDDWWLQRADISHHGCPTPSVDEQLGRPPVNQVQNRAAPESNGRSGRTPMSQSRSHGR